MTLTHTTLLKNLASIREYGLLCSFARQGRAAVWFHQEAQTARLENHVIMKHDGHGQDIVHITYDIPRSWVRKHAKGLYYVPRDVPSSRIKRIRIVRRLVEEVAI